MRKGELLDRIKQCGYDLFNLDSTSRIFIGLKDVGVRVRKTEDLAAPYDVYFSVSLFKLNTALGLSNAERLRDGCQYYLLPDSLLKKMALEDIDAGTIDVEERGTDVTRVSFEQVGHALIFIEVFVRNC